MPFTCSAVSSWFTSCSYCDIPVFLFSLGSPVSANSKSSSIDLAVSVP